MSNIEFEILEKVAMAGSAGVRRSEVVGTAIESNALANLTRKGLVELRSGRFVSVAVFAQEVAP